MKTKDFILETTFGLLLQKGYDGVSISDIQQATGMARGLLYHYFKNKEVLFSEVVERYMQEYFRIEREEVRQFAIGEMIAFVVESYQRMMSALTVESDTGVTLLDYDFLFYQLVQHDAEFAGKYKIQKEAQYAAWKTALMNSFARGELRSGLNMESVAKHFVYITGGAALNGYTNRNWREVVYEIEKGLREFLEIIQKG